jgi:hypothetical protein
LTFINFPNLEELLFLKVLALPNASKSGLVSKTYFSIPFTEPPSPALTSFEMFKKSKSVLKPVAACAR